MSRIGLLIFLVACGGAGHAPAPRTGAVPTAKAAAGSGSNASDDAQREPELQPDPQSGDTARAPEPDPDPSAGADGEADDDSTKIVELEAFGPLRFGADDAAMRKLLGAPKQRTKPVLEAATGEYYSAWSWAGVDADMVSAQTSGPWRVRRIEVSAPNKFATKEGIHIGSTRKEVEAKYRKSKSDGGDPESLLVGAPYGGLLFSFKDGVVTAMSIGVFAF